MPLITIGLGVAYTFIGLAAIIVGIIIVSCLTALFGWVWLGIVAIIVGLWGVGMFVRIPGDAAYDRRESEKYRIY